MRKSSPPDLPPQPAIASSTVDGESSRGSSASGDVPPSLVRLLQWVGQEHLLLHLEALPSHEDRQQLLKELMAVDFERAVRIFSSSTGLPLTQLQGRLEGDVEEEREEGGRERTVDKAASVAAASEGGGGVTKAGPDPAVQWGPFEPASCVARLCERSEEQRQRWWRMGLTAIADGQLAVLLLAGGQGTRLGSSDPKGCYDIGLPSHKSLFQLQAQRILRLQQLAAQFTPCAPSHTGTHNSPSHPSHPPPPLIRWLIMTSPFTHTHTLEFFQANSYFGLQPHQITFFQQSSLPCFSPEGRIILQSKTRLSMAPDGNGGVYHALRSLGILDDLKSAGIRHVEFLSVDNALVKVGDPLFLGYAIDSRVPCAAKVVQKAYPEERVGVFVHQRQVHGRSTGSDSDSNSAHGCGPASVCVRTSVVEYSELPPALATATDADTGQLLFNWSCIVTHLFSVDFLISAADHLHHHSLFHVARKSVPSLHGPVEALKLEQFMFDVVPLAAQVALFEVSRCEEFAPVKNAPGSKSDSPDTARRLLLAQHAGWVKAAGGTVVPSSEMQGRGTSDLCDGGLEVSPLLSYGGEGLEEICHGRQFPALCDVSPF